MTTQHLITLFVTSYLIGSIPTAYIIGRLHRLNIFEIGSGNMGATNAARALGMRWGILVWILDGLKGIAAVLVARALAPSDQQSVATILGAVAVVLGHNWSIFATIITGRVRGGKGSATASGVWVLLVPPLIIAFVLMIGAAIIYVTRYVSLAGLISVSLISVVIIGMVIIDARDPVYIGYMLVTVMIFYRHRTNIKALIKGNERRLGERA